MYTIAWEAESNSSILDHSKKFRDPVTIEDATKRDAVNQQHGDRRFLREQKKPFDEALRPKKHWSQN